MLNGLRNYSLRKSVYFLRYTEFTALLRMFKHRLIAPYSPFRAPVSETKSCLLLSGCPGDPYRYRCEHQAAQLESLGIPTDVGYASQIRESIVVDRYQWLWLHRVPYSERIGALIEAARRSGKPVVFDIDDLVFDENTVPYMRAIEHMSHHDVEQIYERARGYSQTMSRCDFATVSTDELRQAVVNLFPDLRSFVTQNMLSDAQLGLAEQALKAKITGDDQKKDSVTVAYFSGTRTHHADFAACSSAIVRLLESFPKVRLLVVGYLDVGGEFAALRRRVDYHRFVPWQRLANLYARVDINLAPLELDNPFTACKSDLKYFEAAIMGIPTVASAVGSFMKSIVHGENGYLCRTAEEWFHCLARLVEDATLRQRMGSVARTLVLDSRTISCGAQNLDKTLLGSIKTYQRLHSDVATTANRRELAEGALNRSS